MTTYLFTKKTKEQATVVEAVTEKDETSLEDRVESASISSHPLRSWRNMANTLPSNWSLEISAPLSIDESPSAHRTVESSATQLDGISSQDSSQSPWHWDRSTTSTDVRPRHPSIYSDSESISEINITRGKTHVAANSVEDELVTTVYYKDNHFQVLDCSGKTGNRLHVRIIPFNNRRTYVEINHILVLDLDRLYHVAAVLPCGTKKRSAVEIILDDGSPIVLQSCTPAIFAEAMVQLEAHFARQANQARTEVSSVLDCYAFATPATTMERQAEAASPRSDTRADTSLNDPTLNSQLHKASVPKSSFWRRLRK